WLELIKDYDLDILYHPRKANVVADALSRKRTENIASLVTTERRLLDDMRRFELEIVTRQVGEKLANMRIQPNFVDRIKTAQSDAQSILDIKKRLDAGRAPEFYVDDEDVLRYKGRLCVPMQGDLKRELLREAHYSNYSIHPGGNKVCQDLKKLYWWNNMKKKISDYVAKCHICQMINMEHRKPAGELRSLPIPQWKWEHISMDFVSTLPKTKDP